MTKSEFLQALEHELEVPEGSLRGEQLLAQVPAWDSMAAVIFIALADREAGVTVSGDQIAGARTVDQLLALLGNRVAA